MIQSFHNTQYHVLKADAVGCLTRTFPDLHLTNLIFSCVACLTSAQAVFASKEHLVKAEPDTACKISLVLLQLEPDTVHHVVQCVLDDSQSQPDMDLST